MTGFVQIIEWSTSRIDEVQALQDAWRERFPEMGPSRVMVCADRKRLGTYLTIVEFESYAQAMENSTHPATHEFSQRMAELCNAPAVFHDLDVMGSEVRLPTGRRAAMT